VPSMGDNSVAGRTAFLDFEGFSADPMVDKRANVTKNIIAMIQKCHCKVFQDALALIHDKAVE